MNKRLPRFKRPKGGYFDTPMHKREEQGFYLGYPEFILLLIIFLSLIGLGYLLWGYLFRVG